MALRGLSAAGHSGAYGLASLVSARAVVALHRYEAEPWPSPTPSPWRPAALRSCRPLPGSVSNGPGRPPARVPGPRRAGTSFHPHFPLRDSVSRCEETPGSPLASPRAARGVRAARQRSPRRDSTSPRGKTRGAPGPPGLPCLQTSPPRRQKVAPKRGARRRPGGRLGTRRRVSSAGAPGSVCLGRKAREPRRQYPASCSPPLRALLRLGVQEDDGAFLENSGLKGEERTSS